MEERHQTFNSASVLAALLTRHVGRNKTMDVRAVARACNCSDAAVYAAQKGVVSLNLGIAMLRCLPEEAVHEFFAAHSLHVVEAEGEEATHEEAAFCMSEAVYEFTKANRDRRLNHMDDGRLRRLYHRVATCLLRFSMRRRTA